MTNQTANVDFYLGALGPHGFCGYFDRLCQEPDRQMYLIKSGPGCGKSTMIRKIAEASPLPVQRIHCSSDPDSLDGALYQLKHKRFSISAMAFQDAWNLDLERLRNCYIHIMSPEGRLVPFCAYNLTSAGGKPLYRHT